MLETCAGIIYNKSNAHYQKRGIADYQNSDAISVHLVTLEHIRLCMGYIQNRGRVSDSSGTISSTTSTNTMIERKTVTSSSIRKLSSGGSR